VRTKRQGQLSFCDSFVRSIPFSSATNKHTYNNPVIMPMAASGSAVVGAPIVVGGGGSLHDILRHISAETKETKQALSVFKSVSSQSNGDANVDGDANVIADADAATDAKNRQSAAAVDIARAKRTLAQLGPDLLLRGGRGRRDQATVPSLGKRPRVVATEDTVSSSCLDAYRRERDQLTADLTTPSSTNGTSVQQMRDLAAVYLFGLERVGALQDLRQAPDAILPGNFVEQQQPVAAAATATSSTVTAATNTELETNATKAKVHVAVAPSSEIKSHVTVAPSAETEAQTTVVTDDSKK
jgi:hypothetical protein